MALSEATKQKMREAAKRRWAKEKNKASAGSKEIDILQAKVATYEQLIQSYKARINTLENKMNGMVLEYNTRLKYMKECIEHAYTSILFAENAAKSITKIKSEAQND